MKKILTWMTLICMLFSFAALAEDDLIDPFADEDVSVEVDVDANRQNIIDPFADDDASGDHPSGQELFESSTGTNPDWGSVLLDSMNTEVLEARAAAKKDDAPHITSKRGKQMLAFRLYFHPSVENIVYDQAFDAKVQVGDDLYACRKYIESRKRGSTSNEDTAGRGVRMIEVDLFHGGDLYYVVDTNGVEETMTYVEPENYYIFDVYTLLPEGTLESGESVFLVLNVGGQQFWYQAA